MPGPLPGTSIDLNGISYPLARQELLQDAGARTWTVKSMPLPTTHTPRPDVHPGPSPGEWVIVWDDFSRGLAEDSGEGPGKVYYNELGDITHPGVFRPLPSYVGGQRANATWGPVGPLNFGGIIFYFHGRYGYSVIADGTIGQDVDFGAGFTVTTAVVHNNRLVVGFGGATNKIQRRASGAGGAWTAATDAVYADLLAVVNDRLWRLTATNQASNIGPTDDPLTLTNWSAGISVGGPSYGGTGLGALGEQLIVAKPEGMFVGDASAIFPNVLPQLERNPDSRNGRGLHIEGSVVYYPHSRGLVRYTPGLSEEVGPGKQNNPTRNELNHGSRVTAVTTTQSGRPVVATEYSGLPRALPTAVLTTTNSGSSYTSILANLQDNSVQTVGDISSFSTLALGSWILVGYSAAYSGLTLDMTRPNTNTANIRVDVWTGSWTQLTAGRAPYDDTLAPALATPLTNGIATLGRSGMLMWDAGGAGWLASTINGTNAFWARISFDAALSSVVYIGEMRILSGTAGPSVSILLGRPTESGDNHSGPLTWVPIAELQIGIGSTFGYAHTMMAADTLPGFTATPDTPNLLILGSLGWEVILALPDPPGLTGRTDSTTQSRITLPRHDGGMPHQNKQFLQLTAYGRVLGTDTLALDYRLDDSTGAFTSAASSITSRATGVVALSGVTGYKIQPRIGITPAGADPPVEVNRLECVFRELPTYKDHYELNLELGEQGLASGGLPLSAADQVTRLVALRGAASVTLIDPVGRSVTVNVERVDIAEVWQEGTDYPLLLAHVTCAQV